MEPRDEKSTVNTPHEFVLGIKRILSYLNFGNKKTLFLIFLSISASLLATSIPYISGKLIDSLVSKEVLFIFEKSIPVVFIFILLWVSAVGIYDIVEWTRSREAQLFKMRGRMHFIAKTYSHLFKLPLFFHSSLRTGEIIQKIGMVGNRVEAIFEYLIMDIFPQILTLISASVFIFIINPLIGTSLLVGVLFYGIILYKTIKPGAALQKEFQSSFISFHGNISDATQNIRTLKMLTMEDAEVVKINQTISDTMIPKWIPVVNLSRKLLAYQQGLTFFSKLAIYIIGATLVLNAEMSIGELTALVAYMSMLYQPLQRFANLWRTLQNSSVEMNILHDSILAHEPEQIIPSDDKTPEVIKGSIKFENVKFKYPDSEKYVLEDISFTILPGQSVALVGESGMGKSTVIDLVSGYHFPNEGKVKIDNVSTKNLNLKTLRSNIGVVPQEVVLFNDTIYNNLIYGLENITEANVQEATRKAHAFEFIERLPNKWEQIVGERGIKLSVGQKQRIAIARAILRDPAMLILDEPTSALDAKSEHGINESLQELMKNRTTFIIAHRLSTVRKADIIMVLEDGKIVEMGSHNELMSIKNGKYQELHNLQSGNSEIKNNSLNPLLNS